MRRSTYLVSATLGLAALAALCIPAFARGSRPHSSPGQRPAARNAQLMALKQRSNFSPGQRPAVRNAQLMALRQQPQLRAAASLVRGSSAQAQSASGQPQGPNQGIAGGNGANRTYCAQMPPADNSTGNNSCGACSQTSSNNSCGTCSPMGNGSCNGSCGSCSQPASNGTNLAGSRRRGSGRLTGGSPADRWLNGNEWAGRFSSGTVDTSGQGNDVISVDGHVLTLP
jgi:hypothetical protein